MNDQSSQTLRVGLFFVFGLVLIWVIYETLTEASFYKSDGYVIQAPFLDLKQLKVGDDVRMAGVRIGSVLDTTLERDRAVAILNIENTYEIPKDSIAKISTAGLLGANYVNIKPGLETRSMTIDDVLVTVEAADISTVINQIGDISKRIDSFLSGIERAFDYEGERSGTIAMLLHDQSLADDFRLAVSNAAEFTSKINSEYSTIGRLASDDELYQKANDAVNKIQNAVSTVEDSGPITAVGVIAGALF